MGTRINRRVRPGVAGRVSGTRLLDGKDWQGRLNSAILPLAGRILVSLNLKNPRAHELAAELAQLTGESLTSAVIQAIEQRLAEERQKRSRRRTAQRILEFSERFAAGMASGCKSSDHGDLLYGEDGLPR